MADEGGHFERDLAEPAAPVVVADVKTHGQTNAPADAEASAQKNPQPDGKANGQTNGQVDGDHAGPEKEVRPITSPTSPRNFNAIPFVRRKKTGSVDVEDYFTGPRDMDKHSKWPVFLRMHGSILPKMILPLSFIGGWATMVTCITKLTDANLAVNSVLLTVLGFVVGLALSFRSSTAYERYIEGRKYWAQLALTSHNLARIIWVHGSEREGDLGKEDLLAKITSLNLIVAFAVALKHKLRFEPYSNYDDLRCYVNHLDTLSKAASDPEPPTPPKKSIFKVIGEFLGISFAESNPRKLIKRATQPLGNLPLEILSYISSYTETIMGNGTLRFPIHQTHVVNCIMNLNDILTGTDRVLNTPLPIAYSIAISQITWVYVLVLPFQLVTPLDWVAIPGTMVAAYIILGLALIGREIENPFGNDVNDLPLDDFCNSLAEDLDVIMSNTKPKDTEYLRSKDNLPLYPLSGGGYDVWKARSEDKIREALKAKTGMSLNERKSMHVPNGEDKGAV